jgi:multidrug efflux pump
MGSQAYNFAILEDGKPATAAAIQLSPGANAVKTAEGVQAKIEELKLNLPEGMQFRFLMTLHLLLKFQSKK